MRDQKTGEPTAERRDEYHQIEQAVNGRTQLAEAFLLAGSGFGMAEGRMRALGHRPRRCYM